MFDDILSFYGSPEDVENRLDKLRGAPDHDIFFTILPEELTEHLSPIAESFDFRIDELILLVMDYFVLSSVKFDQKEVSSDE